MTPAGFLPDSPAAHCLLSKPPATPAAIFATLVNSTIRPFHRSVRGS
jgi:hypothetical protein